MSRVQASFAAWATWTWNHHRLMGLVALLPLASCPPALRHLQCETLSHGGATNGLGTDYQDAVRRFGEESPLLVLIARTNQATHHIDAFTEALLAEITHWPEIRTVRGHATWTPQFDAAAWCLGTALANSGTNVLAELRARLAPDGLALAERCGTSFAMGARVTLEATDLASGMGAQRTLDRVLADAVAKHEIAGFESPSVLIGYPVTEAARQLCAALCAALPHARDSLPAALAAAGLAINATPAYLSMLADAVDAACAGPAFPTRAAPAVLAARYAATDTSRTYLQTLVWPIGDAGDLSCVKILAERLRALPHPPGITARVASTYEAYEALNNQVRRDFFRVSALAAAVVAVLMGGALP